MEDNPAQWEYLREDLILLPGIKKASGAPTWSILDKSSGNFYRIGLLEFELIKRWSWANPHKIIQDIRSNTILNPSLEDVISFYQFLKKSCLLNARTKADVESLIKIQDLKKQGSIFHKLLKSYLFFRIPLVKPDKFLSLLMPFFYKVNFSAVFIFLVITSVLGAFLVFRDFNSFLSSFSIMQSPSGVALGIVVLIFSKICHELGHALTCKFYGCRVPRMGVAFMLLWPLLWTDTTDAWRLTDNKKRLRIDSAGMLVELGIAAVSSVLWAISPEGAFKDAMHMLAGITWIMTLFVNLNPFMRFDGYYIFSDFLDIPNVQDRSFRLAKNWLRRFLWNIDEPKGDNFSALMELKLIIYAFLTWVYRFFLFLGIALIVYHLFFKALGLFLMIVEIWWFIIRPVANELKYYFMNREKMLISSNKKRIYLSALCVVLLFLIVPWQSNITAPAILKSVNEIPLLSNNGAYIESIAFQSGDEVKRGDVLYTLKSPDLSHALDIKKSNLKILEKDQKSKLSDDFYYTEALLISGELAKIKSEIKLTESEEESLIIRSPIDGIVVDIPDHIKEAGWVAKKEFLGMVRSKDSNIEAYVSEQDSHRISKNTKVKFYYDEPSLSKITGVLSSVSPSIVETITHKELGSNFKGKIDMVLNPSTGEYVPKEAYYTTIIALNKVIQSDKTHMGIVKIKSENESILIGFIRKSLSIFIQESGF